MDLSKLFNSLSNKLEYLNNKINIFINIFVGFYILYFLYNLINSYYNYKNFDNNNITKSTDIDIIGEKYSSCELYKIYNSLTKEDKEYLFHLINTHRLKYKEELPNYNKNYKSIKGSFGNMIATYLTKFKGSAAFDSLKYNCILMALP